MYSKVMKSWAPLVLFTFLLGFAMPSLALAEARKATQEQDENKDSTTSAAKRNSEYSTDNSFTLTIKGKKVAYRVATGFTPIFDSSGLQTGEIFATSYCVEPARNAKNMEEQRPVVFVFNGGPGAASIFLHVGVFGPKTFALEGEGLAIPKPPYQLADNPDSPLDVADFVFVDPIGTGYSRAIDHDDAMKRAEGEEEASANIDGDGFPFWGIIDDAESLAEFIRVWLTANKRWSSPVFLAGESYGALRAPGVTAALESYGIAISGIALISPAMSYMDLETTHDNDIPFIKNIATYAATAHYHKKLAPEFQSLDRAAFVRKVTEWSETTYLQALWKGNLLSEEDFSKIARELSAYTGIDELEIRANRLRLDCGTFAGLLLRDKGLFLSLYDGRMTAPGYFYNYREDPSFIMTGESYLTALMHYFVSSLGVETLRPYVMLNDEVNSNWDFTRGARGLEGLPSTSDLLAGSMRKHPFLKVFIAMGRYDNITPPEAAQQALARMDVPGDRVANNIESHMYEAGHMMYTNPVEKTKLCADFRNWLLTSLK